MTWIVREANERDLLPITEIYNEGIEDRIATLEERPKTPDEVKEWLFRREGRYKVLVAVQDGEVLGWASLNPYSHRCAYAGVADVSVYIRRKWRGRGVGSRLLSALEEKAKKSRFHKMVLFTFPFNGLGQGLYRKQGFREVGIFEKQGVLEGRFVDVMAMEKVLTSDAGRKAGCQ